MGRRAIRIVSHRMMRGTYSSKVVRATEVIPYGIIKKGEVFVKPSSLILLHFQMTHHGHLAKRKEKERRLRNRITGSRRHLAGRPARRARGGGYYTAGSVSGGTQPIRAEGVRARA